ncbi:MAG: hypothetical protein ACK5NG_11250 [Chthoniobacterales bacterium]
MKSSNLLLHLALLTIIRTTPLFAQIEATREVTPTEPNTTNIKFQFPAGYIDYRVTSDGAGLLLEDPKPIFGLSFHRPDGTNGGWNLWNFLRVFFPVDDKLVSITRQYELTNADILENEERLLIRFHWKLPEHYAELNVFFAWYPEQPDWMFVRVQSGEEETFIRRVEVSAFPGNTAGPEERERWFASDKIVEQKLSPERLELDTDTKGLAYFNRHAPDNQEAAGCLLVIGEPEPQPLKIFGDYGVVLEAEFDEGVTSFTFALGGFTEQNAEDVIRVFRMEGIRNVLDFLNKIDWTPKLDTSAHQTLLHDIETLLGEASDKSGKARYDELKTTYREKAATGKPADLIEPVRALAELKAQLIATELAGLK